MATKTYRLTRAEAQRELRDREIDLLDSILMIDLDAGPTPADQRAYDEALWCFNATCRALARATFAEFAELYDAVADDAATQTTEPKETH